MMISVIRRHEIIRRLPKILLMNFAMVAIVAGLTVNEHVDTGNGLLFTKDLLIVVQLFVFLGAAAIMALPEAGRRCREWELSLPVNGAFWWKSHFFSLILAGISMMAVYAVIPLGLGWLGSGLDMMNINIPQLMWDLWALPVLAFSIVVNSFVLMNPGSVHLGRAKGQHLNSLTLVLVMVVLMALCSWYGLTLILLVPLAVLIFLNSRRPISANLELPDANSGDIESNTWESQQAKGSSRRLMHLTIMRLLFKWPVNWIVLIPFASFFGLMLGGFNPITSDPDSMRFTNIFMSIYILTSASGYFSERQHLVDALPIDRRTILLWLVVPLVAAIGLGYGGGRLIAQKSYSTNSAFSLTANEDEYSFSVPARCYKNSPTEEGLEITAPWGETHTAQTVIENENLSWHFHNPYSIPRGASERYAAWQIQRAVAYIYGVKISEEKISDLYLSTDSMGMLRVRNESLNIEEDFALEGTVSSGPVFPLVFGTVVTSFLLILSIMFRSFRWMVSKKRQQLVFWAFMVLLMAGHLGTVFLMSHFPQSWLFQGFILGSMQRWSLAQTGAVPLAYGAALLCIGLSWSLALHHFREVEPPQG